MRVRRAELLVEVNSALPGDEMLGLGRPPVGVLLLALGDPDGLVPDALLPGEAIPFATALPEIVLHGNGAMSAYWWSGSYSPRRLTFPYSSTM